MQTPPVGGRGRKLAIPSPGALADRLGVSAASVVLGALGVAAAAAGGWWALRSPPAPDPVEILPRAVEVSIPTSSSSPAAADTILVHVAGAVTRPGVHELSSGSRVVDAVAAAGGLTTSADSARLNLAETLTDGSRLWVPSMGESKQPEVVRATPGAEPGASGTRTADSGPGAGALNINTAGAAALESLPGIGPSLAAAIIEHRDRAGPFARVEDLDKVSGIGPAKLAQIRPLVSV